MAIQSFAGTEVEREPTSPGEILLEEFLKPLGLTSGGWPIIWAATSR